MVASAWFAEQELPRVPLGQAAAARWLKGRTVWVTRHRPKIDRYRLPLADPAVRGPSTPCSCSLRPAEVEDVADRFNATPFDVEGVHWSHRGDRCTFDVMLEEFSLTTEPLLRLADIVRGADTARPELAPEVGGFAGSLTWACRACSTTIWRSWRPA